MLLDVTALCALAGENQLHFTWHHHDAVAHDFNKLAVAVPHLTENPVIGANHDKAELNRQLSWFRNQEE